MGTILSIVFPLYAAIAIGYGAVRLGAFKPSDMRVLGHYVLSIALPALVFHAIATRDIAEVLQPAYLMVYAAGGLATIAVAFAWFTFTAPDKRRRAVAVMGCACPNSGFIGYPLLLLLFPDLAGLVLAQNVLVENVLLIPLCLVLMDLAEDRESVSVPAMLGRVLRDLLRRPLIVGLLAGLAVSALGIPLPGPVNRLFEMLAASASALALVVIGGTLVGLPMFGNRAMAAQIALGKLLMHPALTTVAALVLTGVGLVVLPPDLRAAVILSAAMPMFGVYTIFAQERGLEGAASLAQLMATSGAFLSLSALLLWLA
ncbi:MAG: transporter [Pseudooceanicola sp.]|nr:transporter [Pseudooceanicola sp.]